jgi:hypothetical protein
MMVAISTILAFQKARLNPTKLTIPTSSATSIADPSGSL